MVTPATSVNGSMERSAPRTAWSAGALEDRSHTLLVSRPQLAWMLALLVVIPIMDARPGSVRSEYDHAYRLFLLGDLTRSQQEAETGYRRLRDSDPERAAKFQLLEAEALVARGMNNDALRVLPEKRYILNDRNAFIQSLTLEGVADTYLGKLDEADRRFAEAQRLCNPETDAACDRVTLSRGLLALEQEKLANARQLFLENLSFARAHQDRRSESSALVNLGYTSLRLDRFDEAVDWSLSAYRAAKDLGIEDKAGTALGNLGFAYYMLGDNVKGLDLLTQAEEIAHKLGSIRNEIWWVGCVANVYRDAGDLNRASSAYRRSLDLATRIKSQQDIVNALEDLAYTDIMAGKLDEANASLDKLTHMVSGHRLDELDVMLAKGEIAAARRQDQKAEAFFLQVEQDKVSQTSMRLEAEHQLARLFEVQGNAVAAEGTYRTALTTFETARDELKNEDSKLRFLTNATPIYDDYIHLLVQQGRADEALAAADQSRAQTLAQGLGLEAGKLSLKPAALRAGDVARKTGATVLFYWLGERQSYLWAVTPAKTSISTLPAQREITALIERYRKALLEPALGRDANNADGQALYRTLVAPAADLIPANANVVVVCDGPLSLLNFDTLLVPGRAPHYWIEDANVVSAPSLYMLAAAKAPVATSKELLLIGDALSPNPDYPELPMAKAEMRKIAEHFAPDEESVFARQAANSGAYLKSPLRDYAYIHFVAHGIASRTDPLDSAIILSRSGAAEDSFKLHAREIIQHPIHARLVTISACYGGGTRSYAGEGLVGLSWAFLRAGAHNVIGALWEASDDSTPQLMDKMYAGLADGMTPSAALRQAKLAMLHSSGRFRQPFYWAPFQIYAGL